MAVGHDPLGRDHLAGGQDTLGYHGYTVYHGYVVYHRHMVYYGYAC